MGAADILAHLTKGPKEATLAYHLRQRGATRKALKEGMDGQKFSGSLTRLHQRLRKALGPAAQAYCVHDGASRPRRYALQLPASAIRCLD